MDSIMITKSNKYAEYIKDYPSYSTAEQTFYEFPNGYGASVIYGPFTYGLEVAVIRWNKDDGAWDFDYLTSITDDVIGHVEELDMVLNEIYDLPEYLELEGEMKKKYKISVHGCDDSTVIEKELTEDELKLVQSIAKEITDSSDYNCMPTMEIGMVDS